MALHTDIQHLLETRGALVNRLNTTRDFNSRNLLRALSSRAEGARFLRRLRLDFYVSNKMYLRMHQRL